MKGLPIVALALGVGLALAGCESVADAAPRRAQRGIEMSVFRVPSRHGLAPRPETRLDVGGPETAGTVLMPPDVVAEPGEEPPDALRRALAAGDGRLARADEPERP